MNPTEVINIVLGAGGVAFMTLATRFFIEWREGTWKHQDTAIDDLEKWRSDADDAREWAEIQHQWWRARAGRLEWVILVKLGPDYVPKAEPYPTKPSLMAKVETRENRQGRHRRTKGER